ncbi:MAG TPA: alpha/beta hydrolase-fold protein [Solirubrobacteraceae bacterium]|nr:alpha/beta hydrolase-fold protein [Solirubrobacteraceae bacterium]
MPVLTRRTVLACGLGLAAGATAAVLDLINHGVLPGQQTLNVLDGACSVPIPAETFAPAGPSISGRFYSPARHRTVGYTIAYPPGHARGSELPLGLVLHAFGENHASTFGGLSLVRALAVRTGEGPSTPIALVAADGGGGYWNRHPGDDPMAMIVDELVPMCRGLGLGRAPRSIGATGISMGGYGALLLAEQHPRLIAAVAAISPAIWTTYDEARGANAGAYASAADFARDDVVTHASALAGRPVRIASGVEDPFHPGVAALARALPAPAVVEFPQGCHDGTFFASQAPASLAFLARHLAHRRGAAPG